MEIKIFHVDTFTDIPFRGNSAAVCVLPGPKSEGWMQDVAREMNLSETAFLHRQKDCFSLRWFTPTIEVDLCGHATLASAHILWETGVLKPQHQALFDTRSGTLTAGQKGKEIELNFPATPDKPVDPPLDFEKALGAVPKYVGRSIFDYLIEVESEEEVRNMKPDFGKLKEFQARGVIVTSISFSNRYDFVSRFFAPRAGIDEDPVTGSAHCCLGPYWSRRIGKDEMVAYQASSRGGEVRVKVAGERVCLGGRAVTVVRGELTACS